MTQEALRMALDALETELSIDWGNQDEFNASAEKMYEAIAAIKEALAQTQEPVAVYGYCPECGAKGVMRERRPNGNDKCANGHTYPSSKSTPPQRKLLTDEKICLIAHNTDPGDWNNLNLKDSWHSGFKQGFKTAEIEYGVKHE